MKYNSGQSSDYFVYISILYICKLILGCHQCGLVWAHTQAKLVHEMRKNKFSVEKIPKSFFILNIPECNHHCRVVN